MARRNSAMVNINGHIRFVEMEVVDAKFYVKTSDNHGIVSIEKIADNHEEQSKIFRQALHDVIESALEAVGIDVGESVASQNLKTHF